MSISWVPLYVVNPYTWLTKWVGFIYLFLNLHIIQNYPKATLVISSYLFHLANSTQAVYIFLEIFIFRNYDLPLWIWQWIIHILPTIEMDIRRLFFLLILCTYQLYAPLPPTRGIPGQGGDLTNELFNRPTHGFIFLIKSPVLSHHQTRGREGDLTMQGHYPHHQTRGKEGDLTVRDIVVL